MIEEEYEPVKKRKGLAVLFSMMFPGMGHMYLGFMQRGLLLMLLFIADIVFLVFLGMQEPFQPFLITLLSLFLPVLYVFTFFDAYHLTVLINRHRRLALDIFPTGDREEAAIPGKLSNRVLAFILLAAAFFLLLFVVSGWIRGFFAYNHLYAVSGAVVLIAGGILMFMTEQLKKGRHR